MTDLIKQADSHSADLADEGAPRGTVPPKRRRLAGSMGLPWAVIVAIGVVLVAGALGAVALTATSGSTEANPSSQSPVSTVSVA